MNRGSVDVSLDDLRAHRRQVFSELLEYPDSWLDSTTHFSFADVPTRWTIHTISDHDEEHLIQISDTLRRNPEWQRSKAIRHLAAAEATRGDLLAAITGLTDDDLDIVPDDPPGEWSLRQTLSHIHFVEHAYRMDVLQSLEHQAEGKPVEELLDLDIPELYPDDTLSQLLDRLDTARDQTIHDLHTVDEAQLAAQGLWGPVPVDANFLMMRLAHHEREHTAHIRKWRLQTGKIQRETERLLGLAWITHGRIRGELVCVPEDVLAHQSIPGEWSPQEVLNHLHQADTVFKDRIDTATPAGDAQSKEKGSNDRYRRWHPPGNQSIPTRDICQTGGYAGIAS